MIHHTRTTYSTLGSFETLWVSNNPFGYFWDCGQKYLVAAATKHPNKRKNRTYVRFLLYRDAGTKRENKKEKSKK